MIELRWLVKEVPLTDEEFVQSMDYGSSKTTKKIKVLQQRVLAGHSWTDWHDVPTRSESCS